MCLSHLSILKISIDADPAVCARVIFLQVVQRVLFGDGRPRYGQTPPIRGILLEDVVKAGAMVSTYLMPVKRSLTTVDKIVHATHDGSDMGTYKDEAYLKIYQNLKDRWGKEQGIDWIIIGAIIFDMRPVRDYQSEVVTDVLLTLDI